MSGLICHIQRAGAGAAITGLRLADRRQVRAWTPGTTSTDADAQRRAVEAAARWISDQLHNAGKRRRLVLTVDLDGSRCAWLSAPSADHEVVRAAAKAAALGSGDEAGGGPGLGVIWSSEHGEPGIDLAVQELTDGRSATGNGTTTAAGHKRRLAVLAVPDACVRVLLDELDRLGVVVDGVKSLWHALAEAWDPSLAEALAGGALGPEAAAAEAGVSEPVTAIVAVEPDGRLCWAWSRCGRLLAAGSQRLRLLEVARAADAAAGADESGSAGAELAPPGTRLRDANAVVEVTSADSGRVIGEWLAWSAQLGVAPMRVVCVGPGDLVATGLPGGTGLGALGQALAAGWPGTHAVAVEDHDPVETTLRRLAGAESGGVARDERAATVAGGSAGQIADLASRPGRLSRAMHWWLGAALGAGACAVGALAWRVDAWARELDESSAREVERRTEILGRVESAFPNITRDPDPSRVLAAGLAQLRKTREDKTPERPIAAAVERVISTAQDVPNLKLRKLTIASITGLTIDFVVPDAGPGGVLLERLRERGPLTGTVGVSWEGSTTTTTINVPGDSGGSEARRVYKLRGFWQDLKPGQAPPRAADPAPSAGDTAPGGGR